MIISLIRGDSHSLLSRIRSKIQMVRDSWRHLRTPYVQRSLVDLTDEEKPQDLVQKNFDFDNLSGSCGSNVFMVGFISWNIHKLDISFSSLTISKFHNLIKRFVLCLIRLKLNISRIWIFFLVCFWSALHF